MSLNSFTKKIKYILIFVFIFLGSLVHFSYGERDYKSCTQENWDQPIMVIGNPSFGKIGYCGNASYLNESSKGAGSIICNLFFEKPLEEQINLKVQDACCEAETSCSSSREFVLYESFVKEVLALINPSLNQSDSSTQIFGLFSSDVLNLGMANTTILQGLAKGYLESANQKIQTALATSIILGSVSVELVQDTVSFFPMLFQAPQIFTDYVKVQKLDAMIHDTVYELGLNGSYESTVSAEIIPKIQKVFKKYEGNGILTGHTDIREGVRNRKIITMLMKVNASMKQLVADGLVTQFEYYDEQGEVRNWRNDQGIAVEFNMEAIRSMKYKYHCARFTSKCNAGLANFKSNMKKLGKSLESGPKESWKLIEDSLKKFSYFMLNGKGANISESDKARYDQSINQLYASLGIINSGTGMTQMRNWRGTMVDKYREIKPKAVTSAKNIYKTIKNTPEYMKDKVASIEARIKKLSQSLASAKEKKIIQTEIQELKAWLVKIRKGEVEIPETTPQEYQNYIHGILSDVLSDQEYDDTAITVASNADLKAKFAPIFENIDFINIYLGGKEIENTIIYNLGKSCERQCENKKGNCYAK